MISYSFGNELSPAEPLGRVELTVNDDGTARLELHRRLSTRTWTATVDPIVWPRLSSTLHDAGFPEIPVPVVASGGRMRTLTTSSGQLRMGWDVFPDELKSALSLLDALVWQISEGAIAVGAEILPRLASTRETTPFSVLGTPSASFGAIGEETLLAVGGLDGRLSLFSHPEGDELAEVVFGDRPLRAVAVSEVDGNLLLAAGADDGLIPVWDTARQDFAPVRPGHRGPIRAVSGAEVDGGVVMFSGGPGTHVLTWGVGAEPFGALPDHRDGVSAMCTTPLGEWTVLACADGSGTIRLWDTASGAQLARLATRGGTVTALAATVHSGQTHLAAASGNTIETWRIEPSLETVAGPALSAHSATVTGACWVDLAGKLTLVSVGLDATMRTWDPVTGVQAMSWPTGDEWIGSMTPIVVSGRPLVAVAGAQRGMVLWDPQAGTSAPDIATPGHLVASAPGLLAVAENDTVVLWDCASGEQRWSTRVDEERVSALALVSSPEGDLVIAGTEAGTLRWHEQATGDLVQVPTPHTDQVLALAFGRSRDTQVLVSGSVDRTVRMWDARTGIPMMRLVGHRAGVTSVALGFAGDREIIVSGGYDGAVRMWAADTGRALLELLTVHSAPIYSVACETFEGRALVASGDRDGTVLVRDASTGEDVLILSGSGLPVRCLAFGAIRGDHVLAGLTEDGMVHIWRLRDGELLVRRLFLRLPMTVHFGLDDEVLVGTTEGPQVLQPS